ncbi:MAG: radical SAM protein, partial [Bacteroidales bacterium]|nr:radical SAM protein [Bacteroidales bacterium]
LPLDIIDLMASESKICNYIDIPVQHISDPVLKLMRRSHGGEETRELLGLLRKKIPEAAIRTTLIAGHPGETESDYKELRDFVSEYHFERLGVFTYSHEENTFGA